MLSRALPIAISYFFISMAFGVIASKYLGYYTIIMSMLVFAGAVQFIAVKMIENGTGVAVIILTTFLVNSRHLLMSSYMSKFFEGGLIRKAVIAFGITDETFAVGSLFKGKFQLKLNTISHFAWVSGTAFGLLFGELIPEDIYSVLPFGLTAMFISILNSNLKGRPYVVAALTSGIVSVLIKNEYGLIVASLLGIFAGGVTERWMS